MHYETKYDQEDPNAKREAAIKDIREWMGDDRYDTVTSGLIAAINAGQIKNFEQLEFFFSIAGTSGYPVRAWAEVHVPDWLTKIEHGDDPLGDHHGRNE